MEIKGLTGPPVVEVQPSSVRPTAPISAVSTQQVAATTLQYENGQRLQLQRKAPVSFPAKPSQQLTVQVKISSTDCHSCR